MKKVTVLLVLLASFFLCSNVIAQTFSCRAKLTVLVDGSLSREFSTLYAPQSLSGYQKIAGCLNNSDLSVAMNLLTEQAFNEICVRTRKFESFTIGQSYFTELTMFNSPGWLDRVESRLAGTGPIYCKERY